MDGWKVKSYSEVGYGIWYNRNGISRLSSCVELFTWGQMYFVLFRILNSWCCKCFKNILCWILKKANVQFCMMFMFWANEIWVEGSSWRVMRKWWRQQRRDMLSYALWHGSSFMLKHVQLSITAVNICRQITSDSYGNIVHWHSCVMLSRRTPGWAAEVHQEANMASASLLVTDVVQVQLARTCWIHVVWTA